MNYQKITETKVETTITTTKRLFAKVEFDEMKVSYRNHFDLVLEALKSGTTVEEMAGCNVSANSLVAENETVLLLNGNVVARLYEE